MKEFAGAIITFSRPNYYKQLMTSLENAVDNDFDWFVFQDGIENAKIRDGKERFLNKELVEKNIFITKNSKLNIKEHFISKNNIKINAQINKVITLFSDYKTLFIFEDDLVVSPYYLRLLKKCSIQYPNIVASFHSIKKGKSPEQLKFLAKADAPRLWGFYLTRNVWDKFSSLWNNFYKKGVYAPFYDVIFTKFIRDHTEGKYEPLVSRAYNIGIDGILSTNKVSWKKRCLDKQDKKIEYNEDKTLSGFILKGR